MTPPASHVCHVWECMHRQQPLAAVFAINTHLSTPSLLHPSPPFSIDTLTGEEDSGELRDDQALLTPARYCPLSSSHRRLRRPTVYNTHKLSFTPFYDKFQDVIHYLSRIVDGLGGVCRSSDADGRSTITTQTKQTPAQRLLMIPVEPKNEQGNGENEDEKSGG